MYAKINLNKQIFRQKKTLQKIFLIKNFDNKYSKKKMGKKKFRTKIASILQQNIFSLTFTLSVTSSKTSLNSCTFPVDESITVTYFWFI